MRVLRRCLPVVACQAALAHPPQLPPDTHTDFTLLSDTFSHARPHPLPTCNTDVPDVHPIIVVHHEGNARSDLHCFHLFMGKDRTAALYLWTNTRAAYFFETIPTLVLRNFWVKSGVLSVRRDACVHFLAATHGTNTN